MTVPPDGPHVEIDNASGDTLTPAVVGSPQKRPTLLNEGLPEMVVPVRRDDKWQAETFDEATARAWLDGNKQPVEELDNHSITPSKSKLTLQGGRDLRDRVQVTVDSRRIHKLIEDLVSTHTSYTPNVDIPRSDSETSTVQTMDTSTEWDNETPTIPSDKPLSNASGGPTPLQTAVLLEAEQFGPSAGGVAVNSNASGGEEAILNGGSVGQYLEFYYNPDYDYPSGAALPLLRLRATGPDPPGFKVEVNGTDVYNITSGGYGSTSLDWLATSTGALTGTPPAVSAGTDVTVRIEVTETGADDINIDVGGVADDRYSYTFPDSLDANGYLVGPEPFPPSISQELVNVTTNDAITGASVSVDSTLAEIALSQDGGATYPYTATDDTSLDAEFDDLSAQLRARLTFKRHGSGREQTPSSGYLVQSADSITVDAELSTIPLVVNQRYDDDLLSILQDLLDKGDMLAEYRDDGTTKSIEVAQSGQRTSDKAPTVSDYEITKQTTTYERAVVEGAGQNTQESITANHGTAVALDNSPLVAGSERVTDSNGNPYQRSADYDVDPQDGTITTLSSGAITDGESLDVEYRYKITGSYTADGVTTPNRTYRETITGLTTARAAEQAARIIVRNIKIPRWEATVKVDPEDTGWSLIDDLALPETPTGGKLLKIERVETTPSSIQLTLGSRETAQQVVNDIRSQLSAVSSRV